MEHELDEIYKADRPALSSMDNNNNEFQLVWLNPFQRFCQDHGLEIKHFNLRKIEKEFMTGNVQTWHQMMSKKPQSENELKLFQFDPILLQHHRLHELCKLYPTQKYQNLIAAFINRQAHLQNAKTALFTQEYGNMFEINWSKTTNTTQNVWVIAVSGSYEPPNIQDVFNKSDCVIYFCKPFGDLLINELRVMKEPKEMIKIHSGGQAMLLNNTVMKIGARPMFSILSLEIQNQVTNTTVTFLDIENGVAMWIKASSKVTKPLFYVPQLIKNCTI